jgi:DUF971 family protein|tara:strand:+ start:378 stop:749 length:372 start_codon:yes stop_codon:yes gene_type:complete
MIVNDIFMKIPKDIILSKGKNKIQLIFSDLNKVSLDAEFLRVKSPSAEVRGHGPDDAITVYGKKSVLISKLELVGNYAIRIFFDDNHSTGIYTWNYLDELYKNRDNIWNDYISELRLKKLNRE